MAPTKYSKGQLMHMLDMEDAPIFVATDETDAVLGYAFCESEQILGSKLRTDVKTFYLDDLCVDENAGGGSM